MESHLSDVPPEVSSAQVMEYTLFCPFENGIEGFSRIDMDIVSAELLGTVVDGIMSRVVLADRLVRMQLITHYMGLRLNCLGNPKGQIAVAVSRDKFSFDISLTLNGNMDTAFPSAFATGIGNSLNKTWLAA